MFMSLYSSQLYLTQTLNSQGLEDDFIAELEGDHVDEHDHDTAHQSDMVFGLNPVHEVRAALSHSIQVGNTQPQK
jgi:hypothetical protein